MSKRPPYTPPIPIERLEAMRIALLRHIYAGELEKNCEPLSVAMAKEIERAIDLLISGPPRRRRATQENMRAAAMARFAISALKIPQEVAVAVAFENPRGVDVDSLTRTYRNLLPLLSEFGDLPASTEIDRWLMAYHQTEYYKAKKKAKTGRIKAR